MLKMRIFWKKM